MNTRPMPIVNRSDPDPDRTDLILDKTIILYYTILYTITILQTNKFKFINKQSINVNVDF